MIIPFAEPTAPRYIYINPANNLVHLLVPVVGGQEISTDNTCQSAKMLDEFFHKGAAMRELLGYKKALEFDLQWLGDHSLKATKQARLAQVCAYIKDLPAIHETYEEALASLMQAGSNLYSIQLRPRQQDSASRVVNPVFSINRNNDTTGTPESAFYNAMHLTFPKVTIAKIAPRDQLNQAIISALIEQPVNFEVIQRILNEQCQSLFGLSINFFENVEGAALAQASVDILMGFTPENPATTEDYINALLGVCAPNLWENIPIPFFYSVRNDTDKADETEKLSILTQFFLAHVNIYCVARGISVKNFGTILDESLLLSAKVASIVTRALSTGADVEHKLSTFFNEHLFEFGLNRPLSQVDISLIRQKFERTYKTVTATKENSHMDDFMILDTAVDTGKFVTHQGSICTDFSQLVSHQPVMTWLMSSSPTMFLRNMSRISNMYHTLRLDFEHQPGRIIPPNNIHIQGNIDLSFDALIMHLKDNHEFDALPTKIKYACMKLPEFKLWSFLHDVAKGKQAEANSLLASHEPEKTQELLTSSETFTDFSGRTFNCTAYEYAYWAKDKHMCGMLEAHMDEATKSQLLERCEVMEQSGLVYLQQGVNKSSKHFDLAPLFNALQDYIKGYEHWAGRRNWSVMKAAWLRIGLVQRDLPIHVINEYCRRDRICRFAAHLYEYTLPRYMSCYNDASGEFVPLFPLNHHASSGLGVDFSLLRGLNSSLGWLARVERERGGGSTMAAFDLAALRLFDEVRTNDLKQSLENLGKLRVLEHGHGFS